MAIESVHIKELKVLKENCGRDGNTMFKIWTGKKGIVMFAPPGAIEEGQTLDLDVNQDGEYKGRPNWKADFPKGATRGDNSGSTQGHAALSSGLVAASGLSNKELSMLMAASMFSGSELDEALGSAVDKVFAVAREIYDKLEGKKAEEPPPPAVDDDLPF